MKLLVVESESDALKRLIRVLQRHAIDPIVALDGNQALDLAISARPDLILMETRLDKLSGFCCCQVPEIRRKNEFDRAYFSQQSG